MGLWIRNADKTLLLKANEIAVRPIAISSGMHGQVMCRDLVDYDSELNNNEKLEFAVYVNDLVCGTYSTKEKALKVLDEIQNKLMGASKIMLQPHQNLSVLSHKDFEKVSNRAKEELRQDICVLSNLFDYSVVNQEMIFYEMPADDEVK